MTRPILTITPLKAAAPLAASAELHLLVCVSCPPADPASAKPRPPLNLSLAIDRSGSMRGHPLAEAKACARRVVQALGERDRVSIISYDDVPVVDVPPVHVTGKAGILAAIDRIQHRGCTNLHGGWLAAAEAAATGLAAGVLTRVMVLSDGNANIGLRDLDEIASQAAALAGTGITTSTIGLGREFNEDLMTALARAGQGQATYGETADDLWPSFEAELGLLSATFGKRVRLTLSSPCGGTVSAGSGLLPAGRDGVWILPNLAHEAEVTALVKVQVAGLSGADACLLEAAVTYDGMDGAAAAPLTASARVPLVGFADFVAGAADSKVAGCIKETAAADLQLEAKAAARQGDFAAVRGIADKLAAMADGSALTCRLSHRMAFAPGMDLCRRGLHPGTRHGSQVAGGTGGPADRPPLAACHSSCSRIDPRIARKAAAAEWSGQDSRQQLLSPA